MRTIWINPSGSNAVSFQIDSGEAQFIGKEGVQEVIVDYGYFVNEEEVLDEDTMVPEVLLKNKCVVFCQTPDQVARARSIGAKIRVAVSTPAVLAVEGQLEHGTLDVRNTGGCAVVMSSGTATITRIKGTVKIVTKSGSLTVSGLIRGYKHQLRLEVGTLSLYAGDLVALVSAMVDQGIIQGAYLGRLERKGLSGWVLYPGDYDPMTTIECTVGSGTITMHSNVL